MIHTPTKKKTILVVEDDRPLLKVVNARLEKKGFGVITARSVDEVFNARLEKKGFGAITASRIMQAIDYLEDLEKIDGIWLDHNLLGKKNGLDLVKTVKANGGRLEKIPIFIISNTENPKTVQSYTDLGIRKYYVKSNHSLDEIIAEINLSTRLQA